MAPISKPAIAIASALGRVLLRAVTSPAGPSCGLAAGHQTGWYQSDAYQAITPIRNKGMNSQFHLLG